MGAQRSEGGTHASLGQGQKHQEKESVAWRQGPLPELCERVGSWSQRRNSSRRAKEKKGWLPFAKVAGGSRASRLKSCLISTFCPGNPLMSRGVFALLISL